MCLLLLPYSCLCQDGTPPSDQAIFHLERPLPAWKTSPLPAGSPHPIQSFPNLATPTSGDGAPPTAWNRALSSLQIPLRPRWPPPRWERLPPSPLLRQEPEHRRGRLLAVTGLASSFLCWCRAKRRAVVLGSYNHRRLHHRLMAIVEFVSVLSLCGFLSIVWI
jgi:hypothetical protein